MTYRVRITKGCPSIGYTKGQTVTIEPEYVRAFGVRACRASADRQRESLWFTQARSRVPVLTVGQMIRLNSGNPAHVVVAEVEEVYPACA